MFIKVVLSNSSFTCGKELSNLLVFVTPLDRCHVIDQLGYKVG